jgi:hypothetical protein
MRERWRESTAAFHPTFETVWREVETEVKTDWAAEGSEDRA